LLDLPAGRIFKATVNFRRGKIMSRLCLHLAVSLALGAALVPGGALAQSQNSQSVADAARRAREAKEKAAQSSQKPKVITNDDIRPSEAKPATDSASGSATPAPVPSADAAPARAPVAPMADSGSAPAEGVRPAQDSNSAAPSPNDSPEIAQAKRALAEAQQDLDFLKRELALDQDTFYSAPGHDRDSAGKAKLDAEQQQIDAKQALVSDLKARLAKLLSANSSSGQPQAPQL
jgi:hypothetical protein